MADELDELKRRQDELEEFLNVLESRLSTQETLMRIVDTAGKPTVQTDTQDEGARYSGHESLLRSIALHQSFHATHLKRVEWEQRGLRRNMENVAGKLSAVEETLRRVDRSIQELAKRIDIG